MHDSKRWQLDHTTLLIERDTLVPFAKQIRDEIMCMCGLPLYFLYTRDTVMYVREPALIFVVEIY